MFYQVYLNEELRHASAKNVARIPVCGRYFLLLVLPTGDQLLFVLLINTSMDNEKLVD